MIAPVAELHDGTSDVARLLGAVVIESADRLTFAGRPVTLDAGGDGDVSETACRTLAELFYVFGYCRRFDGTLADPPNLNGVDLCDALSRANSSRAGWDEGYIVERVHTDGSVDAARGARSVRTRAGQYVLEDGEPSPRPGSPVRIARARESRRAQPGYYYAFGETALDLDAASRAVRLYWNVRVDGATELLRTMTTKLNALRVPFVMKVCSCSGLFTRIDTAVLYVAARYVDATAWIVAGELGELAHLLRPDTPLFTKRLAPGLALAEDPGGESFGLARCMLLASATWSAWAAGRNDVAGRLAALRRLAGEAGLSLERLYLNPGSVDRYRLPRTAPR
ncbi:MAG TPA: T3SS effector HopA1 family protein [Candidatus Limnocylindrales bacterium]|nr:T3SS effector HopA1 family protein [Candidatus Limnocylindrales bacterium]